MTTMGDRIRGLRLSRNMTLEELGNLVGVQKSAVLKWENGTVKNLKLETQNKLAEIFDVSVAYLTGNIDWEEYDKKIDIDKLKLEVKISENYGDNSITLLNNYKLLDDKNKDKLIDISYSMIKKDDYTTIYVIEKAEDCNYGYDKITPYKTDRTDLRDYDFAIFITDDTMEPRYNNGDVILVNSGYDNVNGDVYLIEYNGKAYVKKLYNDGDRYRLVSINDKYEPIKIDIPIDDNSCFNIIGKVVDSFTPID